MKSLIKYLSMIAFAAMAVGILACGDEEEDEDLIAEVIAGFTFTLEEDTGKVTFLNTSENADEYEWIFGDGGTSMEINPTRTFATGTFTVELKASNSGGSDTFSDEITVLIPLIISLPASFDTENTIFEANVFGGASFEVVDNPDLSGTNSIASKVGAITNIGAAFEGISFDLGADIELVSEKSITMNFWADAAVDVLMKLEEGTGANIETTASHGGTGWEGITFDFNSADRYSRLTIFVDGPGTTAGTFYIDNIMQAATLDTTPPIITLIGDATVNTSLGQAYIDPGATANDNIDGDITNNIEVDGTVNVNALGAYVLTYSVSDASGNSASAQRTVNVVEGDTTPPVITLTGGSPIEVTVGDSYTDPGFSANDAVDGDLTSSVVVGGDTVDPNTIGTYNVTYTVSDASNNEAVVTRVVNVVAAGFDDGLLTNGDFETGAASPWTGNGGDPDIQTNGGNSFYFANLLSPGGNPFDVNLQQVVELTQGSSYTLTFEASTGAGTTRNITAGIGLNEQPFSGIERTIMLTDQTQTFTEVFTSIDFGIANSRVFFDLAAEAGVVVIDNVSLVLNSSGGGDTTPPVITLLGSTPVNIAVGATYTAVEDAGATANDDTDGNITDDIVTTGLPVNTTTDGTFIVRYNVSDAATNAATEVTRTVIVGTGGSSSHDSGIGTNGDLETGDLTGWETFANGGTITVDNTLNNTTGGSNSIKAVTNGASNPTIKQERKGAGTVAAGDVVKIDFDHYGSISGIGGVLDVRAFVEVDGGGVSFTEVITAPTLSESWTSFTHQFTIPATGVDVTGGVTLQVSAICGGGADCEVSINMDNVSITLNP